MKKFLGMCVLRDCAHLTIFNSRLIESTVTRFGLVDVMRMPTSITSGVQKQVDSEGETFEAPYSQLVDLLLYMANTLRPDILFEVARVWALFALNQECLIGK